VKATARGSARWWYWSAVSITQEFVVVATIGRTCVGAADLSYHDMMAGTKTQDS